MHGTGGWHSPPPYDFLEAGSVETTSQSTSHDREFLEFEYLMFFLFFLVTWEIGI